MRRLPARRLPVPPGITPSAMSVPTSAAAACIVVPSPPNTATTSTPSETPYSARRRASPGPPVASTSAVHPAPRMTLITASTARCWVLAAAGLVISNARGISVFALPQQVHTDLVAIPGVYRNDRRPAPLDGGLERALEPPFPAEAELEAGTEVPGAELTQVGAEADVEGDEGLPSELPSCRELGGRGDAAGARHAGPNLDQVHGDAEILDQGPLQLAAKRAGEDLDHIRA